MDRSTGDGLTLFDNQISHLQSLTFPQLSKIHAFSESCGGSIESAFPPSDTVLELDSRHDVVLFETKLDFYLKIQTYLNTIFFGSGYFQPDPL